MPDAKRELSSWKEIAAFLNVDVRTCQRWERAFGLPVHRIADSARSRVIAYPEEIAAWRKNAFRVRSEENGSPDGEPRAPRNEEGGPGAPSDPSDMPGTSAKKRKSIRLLIAGLGLGLVVFVVGPSLDKNPRDFRINGARFIALNRFGRTLWEFETRAANLRDDAWYHERYAVKRYVDSADGVTAEFPRVIIRDLDEDGKNEVVWAVKTTDEFNEGLVFFLDHDGTKTWEFSCGRDVRVGNRRFPPDFVVNILDIRDIRGDPRPEILIGSHGYQRSPTQLVLLDLEKRILGEYWNYGQVADYQMADCDADGRDEIIFVGTNREYGQACLFALDPDHMEGTSPQGPDYRFEGMPEGREKIFLRVPATEIDRQNYTRGIFRVIREMGNAQLVAETGGSLIWYEFEESLGLPQITFTDAWNRIYDDLFHKGILPERDDISLRKLLTAGILYHDGETGSWVNRRALSRPPQSLPNRGN